MAEVEGVFEGGRTPRPYQLEGTIWLAEKQRAFLTDGFGLGKTCQAVWAAEHPTMVACPKHIIPHWVREIRACAPGAKVVVADAPSFAGRKRQMNSATDAQFYVFNIELFRTDMPSWFHGLQRGADGRVAVKTLIVDEAHRLRGRNSAQGRNANVIAGLVPRVYLLTATPVYNQVNDLYWPLHMLDPRRFSSYYSFIEVYCKTVQTPWGPKIMGLRRDKALKGVFAEYALGRTREDVKAQLPVLQETLVEIEADKEFYQTYTQTKATYRDRYQRMLMTQQSVLVALRNLTQQAKAAAVVQLVVDSGAHNTVIYTYHRDLAKALGHLLGWKVITGDMPATQREAAAHGVDTLVATFPSVAEGIDLSHMQNVIYVEHDWSPGMMDQSLNRVHRPTSPHTHTHVYHVVVKKTVDAVIYRSYKHRELTMDEIVEAALVPFDTGTDMEGAA